MCWCTPKVYFKRCFQSPFTWLEIKRIWIFFQILFQRASLHVQSYIIFFRLWLKKLKKEKQYITIFVILYYHKFVDITFNEIGLVARRTKGCNSSFEGKDFRTNKKWRSKMTIPCPLISRWYWICSCLQKCANESSRTLSRYCYKRFKTYNGT